MNKSTRHRSDICVCEPHFVGLSSDKTMKSLRMLANASVGCSLAFLKMRQNLAFIH